MDATANTEAQAPVITLSDAALKEVKRLINVQGIEEGGLRLGVKGGGCSGLSYTINFDEKIGQYDQVYEFDSVKVIVDAKSAIYLQGTQLDFQKDLMGGQFKFVNPNANKTCGCGESFSGLNEYRPWMDIPLRPVLDASCRWPAVCAGTANPKCRENISATVA